MTASTMTTLCHMTLPAGHERQPTRSLAMDSMTWIAIVSILTAGLTIAIGSIGPALGEARAVVQALASIAQQPDESATITRTLFVGLAMIESTAIYCFVVAMILVFANPFWDRVAGG
jgi:F-type H+-transporting ATPase subunit c